MDETSTTRAAKPENRQNEARDVPPPRHAEAVMRRLTTFTPEEVAEMVGATAWWVREQAKNRNVPHVRAGRGKVMFRESDVLFLLDSMAVEPREDAEVSVSDVHNEPSRQSQTNSLDMRDVALMAGVSPRAATRMARSAG
jgi:hypothetical protein